MNAKNQVSISDDIIEVQVVGDQTYDSVMAMGKEVQEALETMSTAGQPGLILDDLIQIGLTDTPARQAVSQLARSLKYKKIAMVAQPSILMRYGTKLLLQAIGMGRKIKYFESREAALRWLKADGQ
jgi:hypothetical protein